MQRSSPYWFPFLVSDIKARNNQVDPYDFVVCTIDVSDYCRDVWYDCDFTIVDMYDCDFTIVDMYDCDFESSMCRWRSESQQWIWERSSAAYSNKTIGAGPEEDASGSKTGGLIQQCFTILHAITV